MRPLARVLLTALIALLAAVGAMRSGGAAETDRANAALLDRYFAAVNAHDVAGLRDVIASRYIQHDRNQGQGLEGMQAAFRSYFEMFPDFHWTLEDSVVTNDTVVARFRITATHDRTIRLGPDAPALPPTGRKLAWEGISIWRVADGKFVEHWGVDDLLGLVQQVRAQPAPPAQRSETR
jgi:predicted ester cyclase